MPESNNPCRVDPSKYVVLDVETNGLSSIKDDLFSISIFKPDTGEIYNRFLPMELNTEVKTTHINGIKAEDLKGCLPLSQNEVDEIIKVFELKNRTILIYSNLDERFITKYFERHRLNGIEYFAFYNFKHEIISSRFAEGNITKDNLCRLYGVGNVQQVHSGSNDCVLEWELFKHMNGHRLLITDNNVFEFNEDYTVPASFLTTYPNFKYYLPDLPEIESDDMRWFWVTVSSKNIKRFPTNFNGMIFEHLINSMLNVKRIDSKKELLENKKKLKYIGRLPSTVDIVPMVFNEDGSMTATRPQDKKLEEEINAEIESLKEQLKPLVDFIREKIFNGQTINSQELVVHPKENILALCDLSNENAVLEIKASYAASPKDYAAQLYYEANGRNCYVMYTNWRIERIGITITFNIHKVTFEVKEHINRKQILFENAKNRIETDSIELLSYINRKSPVRVRCKECGNEWNMSYNMAIKQRPCPNCHPSFWDSGNTRNKMTQADSMTKEERRAFNKYMRSKLKIERISGQKITITSYNGSKAQVNAKCMVCGKEWEVRFDHLLARPYCRNCANIIKG